jgi:hypothetical protein
MMACVRMLCETNWHSNTASLFEQIRMIYPGKAQPGHPCLRRGVPRTCWLLRKRTAFRPQGIEYVIDFSTNL